MRTVPSGLRSVKAATPTGSDPDCGDLAPYFHHIQVEGGFGACKPDARLYEHALRAVRVSPAEAWMVGDNLEWDVKGAQQVGIRGIWRDVASAGLPSPSPAQPDRIIRSLTDLLPA